MFKVFVDTNVLIYAFDPLDTNKRRISRERLSELANAGSGVISTQVLQEFYVIAVKKLLMKPLAAKQIIATFHGFEVVNINTDLINEAIDCGILNQLSFWDALIVVSANQARCSLLLTEDLSHGQVIKNLRIENIFKANPSGFGSRQKPEN
jgi:predicted nucleic acid-binding protein